MAKYWVFINDEIYQIRETPLGGMGHSGELETSIMMHISSVYVDNDKAMFKYQFYKGNKWHCPDMFAKNTII